MDAATWWVLDPPAKWKAGEVGNPGQPFYFDCAGESCPAPKEAPIAAFIGTGPSFHEIGLLKSDMGDPFRKLAMFCEPCARAKGCPMEPGRSCETEDCAEPGVTKFPGGEWLCQRHANNSPEGS